MIWRLRHKWESRKRLRSRSTLTAWVEIQMGRFISQIADDRNERAQAIDREVDDFFAAGARLTKAFIRWLESQRDQGERAGAVEIATTPSQSEPLMTVEDLASYLQIKAQTLYTWARDGRIPCERPNGEIRFRRSAIDQWMKPDSKDKPENSPHTNDSVVNSPRSFLRPQNRSKLNGRV